MNADEIVGIAVIGAGSIGRAVSAEFALAGYRVGLHSRSAESLEGGVEGIAEIFRRMVRLGMATQDAVDGARPRIRPQLGLEESTAGAQLVFEAVYEDRGLKKEIFARLDHLCEPRAILVSGTSTRSA